MLIGDQLAKRLCEPTVGDRQAPYLLLKSISRGSVRIGTSDDATGFLRPLASSPGWRPRALQIDLHRTPLATRLAGTLDTPSWPRAIRHLAASSEQRRDGALVDVLLRAQTPGRSITRSISARELRRRATNGR
jgi:hypothetical protein